MWDILVGVTATKQQMLILYYQRLYLKYSFFKVANENPLLAICTSSIMSKPLHPQVLLYYNINSIKKQEKKSNVKFPFDFLKMLQQIEQLFFLLHSFWY